MFLKIGGSATRSLSPSTTPPITYTKKNMPKKGDQLIPYEQNTNNILTARG
ncbi:hypothetical protein Scep_012839 [Stephania cephalantha]|uniref:Uncharacterized protein n=1 Tax=Stephania cephalantha TaxID=152367 RepID=A0AAP0JFW0_9MAGN